MNRNQRYRTAAVILAAATLCTCTGCSRWMLGSNALSFVAGWFLRDATQAGVETRECFVNGVAVDCADIVVAE